MNKRGYIFSVLVIVVIIIVAAGVSVRQSERTSDPDVVSSHLLSVSGFLDQLDADLVRVLHITGYRSLLGLEEHVSSTGAYLPNLSASFSEVMSNGTVDGVQYEIMEDASLAAYQSRVEVIARDLGVELQLTLVNLTVEHVGPFDVRVNSTVQVYAETRDPGTLWNYSTIVSSDFSIEQLKDPLYAVGALGRAPAVIFPTNQSHPYIDAVGNTTVLQIVFNDTHYVADPDGPTFLMRFEGNLSPHQHGIASLVDTQELDDQDLPVFTDRSVVDHLYFGPSATSINKIVNMSDDFLLDDGHLALFDAEDWVRP